MLLLSLMQQPIGTWFNAWPGPGLRISIYRDRDWEFQFTGTVTETKNSYLTGTGTNNPILPGLDYFFWLVFVSAFNLIACYIIHLEFSVKCQVKIGLRLKLEHNWTIFICTVKSSVLGCLIGIGLFDRYWVYYIYIDFGLQYNVKLHNFQL